MRGRYVTQIYIDAHCTLDTTRAPRPGETDGNHYHFVSTQRFKDLIQEGAFIEYAEFSGNIYGTSFATVRSVQGQGRRCILDIEAQVFISTISFFCVSCIADPILRAFVKSKRLTLTRCICSSPRLP